MSPWPSSLLAPAGAALSAFVLPQRCPACGGAAPADALLCTDCTDGIPVLAMALCARCLAAEREPVGCAAHPGFSVYPAWIYDARAALVVHALKYHGRPSLARALAPALVRAARHLAPDVVAPVPLGRARQRERGYNQALELAAELADAAGAPLDPELLVRVRGGRPQARLGREARRRNVRDAFRVRHPERTRGRRVLVVDDVVTTGATFEAVLGTLRRAGCDAAGVALAWAQ